MLKKSLLILALSSLFFVLQCGPSGVEKMPADMEKQVRILSQWSNVVGYVNFSEIRQSAMFELFFKDDWNPLKNSSDYRDFVEKTGLDVKKNITAVYAAANFGKNERNRQVLFIIEGQFNTQKLVDYFNEMSETRPLQPEKYKSFTIYTPKNDDVSICFIDERQALAGTNSHIKKYLDASSAGPINENSTLLSRVNSLKYKKQGWLVVSSALFSEGLNTRDLKKWNVLKSLQYTAMSCKMSDSFSMQAVGAFDDAEKAELLRDAIKGVIAAVKLSVSNDRDVIDVLNKIDVENNNEKMQIDLSMTRDEVKKLMDKRDELKREII